MLKVNNAHAHVPLLSEILCEDPFVLTHTGYVWNGNIKPGTNVLYHCEEGFYSEGGNNVSVCTEQGLWTKPTVACKGSLLYCLLKCNVAMS